MTSVSRYETFVPFYPVNDLAATRDFYGRDLGLTLERDEGRCLVFAAGTGYLGFCLQEDPLPQRSGMVLTFLTADVDGSYKYLRRLGVETEDEPKEDPHLGVYRFFARDPDGYLIEIRRRIERNER